MLKFHPEPGTILICDYSTGFRLPEMVKKRPVVTISPRLKRRDGLITVVPLSTSPPDPVFDHHCKISLKQALPEPFDSAEMWVRPICWLRSVLGAWIWSEPAEIR